MITTTATPSVITRLNREWQARWADHEYDFPHGRMSCQQTLQIVSERQPHADAVLRGLLTAASQDGLNDAVCARTALQIILPRVVSIAAQCARRQRVQHAGVYEEPFAVTVALALERIKHAPLHRRGSVLGNLAMDLLKFSLAHFTAAEAEIATDTTDTRVFDPRDLTEASRAAAGISATEEATQQVLALAAWARDREVLTEAETSMLVSYELADAAERKQQAARHGIESRALCLRVHRVRQTLKKAVCAHALQRTDLMPQMAA
ncbi:hypothetical protein V3N95_11715 (plasmid) [Micrococcaceae bacterium Sec6.3]